jgi:hypothetical protein
MHPTNERRPVLRAATLAWQTTGLRWLIALIGALVLLAATTTSGLAANPNGAPGNNGTVKVHDNNPGEPDPVIKNQPHVCQFDLHFFFEDAGQTGDWWIQEWPPTSATGPTSDPTGAELSGIYEDPDLNREDREPDVAGTYYTLPDGHYKLFWEGALNPGGQQNIKHKVFWVDCAPAPPVTGNAPLLKVDQAGAGKAGAVFTLTGVMGTTFSATATSGATGATAFSSLAAGNYSLAETTPPTGCTGFAGTLALTVAANGTVSFGTLPTGVTIVSGTVRVVNTCAPAPPVTGNVPLLKVDQAGAGKAGAVFTLTGVMGTTFSATATSGATGAAAFSSLAAGNYSLAETTPPTGCTGFAGTLALTVAANGTVSFGTLPTGVTIVSGTVRVVNTCGAATQGGTSPSAGGAVTSRAGTLSSSAGGAAAAGLPNTAMERPSDGLTAELLVLAAIAGLGMGWRRLAASARRRR